MKCFWRHTWTYRNERVNQYRRCSKCGKLQVFASSTDAYTYGDYWSNREEKIADFINKEFKSPKLEQLKKQA